MLGDETDAAVTVAKAVLQVQAANECWDKEFVDDMMREKEVGALIVKAGAHPSLLKNARGFSAEQCSKGGKASGALQLKNKTGLFEENDKGERIYGFSAEQRSKGGKASQKNKTGLFKENDKGERICNGGNLQRVELAPELRTSPRTAFKFFNNQRRAELNESQDASWLAMDSGSRVSFLAKQWKDLPDCTKKPFSEAAVTERQQYQQHQQHQHQQQQQQQAQAQAQAQQQANAAEVARVEAKATEKAAAKAKVKADAEAAAAAAEAAAAEARRQGLI